MILPRLLVSTVATFLSATAASVADDAAANAWKPLPEGTIVGQRHDIPMGWSPELKKFLVLGGRTHSGEYRNPRPYDVLALDPDAGRWENAYPAGKEWGPKSGPCQAPRWKDERFGFQDSEGNVRPNWCVYGTFSIGRKHDYDPDTKTFVFYAGGRTFRYDPASREWLDLAPPSHPEGELGGILLWSSMCYDQHNKRFLLFGGGNIRTERGDPGTWSYTPATNEWKRLELADQPPQRANARLVYDPVHKKVVMFGGDTLSTLIADTWTFDVRTDRWEKKNPKVSPSPRAAQAMLWLPKSKKVLLLGGYTYSSTTGYVASLYMPLPLEAWTYDEGADEWRLVKRFVPKESPEFPSNAFATAAAGDDDTVVALDARRGTWMCRIDAATADDAGTAEHGVAAGATTQRIGSHDPAWYADVPAAEPDKVAAELRDLPANRWTLRPTPKIPQMNMDWGSAVFLPHSDQIVRFSGGHSAYSGTAPQVYDVKTDRYSIPFAPEYPVEYVYSNDQVHGEWSFRGNPWMTGHTYKSTGYDPRVKAFVFAPHDYTYFFDPKAGAWTRGKEPNPYIADFYAATVAATPDGALLWGNSRTNREDGLWRLNAETLEWKRLPLKGKLPGKSADHHGMVYDSKRGRLLFFSDVGMSPGNVTAYDFATGNATLLDPKGLNRAKAHSRETIYLPEHDVVMLCARTKTDDGYLWLAYDCAANQWLGLDLPGDDPIGRGTQQGTFHNSVGLMFDPGRSLVWAVDQYSKVRVLRLDLKTARVTRFED